MSNERQSMTATSSAEQKAKPSAKPKNKAQASDEQNAVTKQDVLDMVTSVIGYLRKAGVDVSIRNHPELGAIVAIKGVGAYTNDIFLPLPNQNTALPN